MGIRNSINEDLGYTSAQLVYGQKNCLPGELIIKSTNIADCNPSSFVTKLRKYFNSIRPIWK